MAHGHHARGGVAVPRAAGRITSRHRALTFTAAAARW